MKGWNSSCGSRGTGGHSWPSPSKLPPEVAVEPCGPARLIPTGLHSSATRRKSCGRGTCPPGLGILSPPSEAIPIPADLHKSHCLQFSLANNLPSREWLGNTGASATRGQAQGWPPQQHPDPFPFAGSAQQDLLPPGAEIPPEIPADTVSIGAAVRASGAARLQQPSAGSPMPAACRVLPLKLWVPWTSPLPLDQ